MGHTSLPQRFALNAMRARFELVLDQPDERGARALADLSFEEVREVEVRWSRFRRDSLVAQLQRGHWVALDQDDLELLSTAEAIRAASGGAFDVTLGTGTLELDLTAGRARLDGRQARLDLGGIAKGHGIDLALRALTEEGITSALLHGGTSAVGALGAPPTDPGGWRVAVGADEDSPRAQLLDAVLAVSARAAGGAGNGRAHLVDPRHGAAARGPLVAAIALPIADSCARADALATALALDPNTDAALGVEHVLLHAGRRSHHAPDPAQARFALPTPTP